MLGETTFESAGKQPPLPFEVAYDPAQIEAGRIYTVRATITLSGKLRFTTDTVTRVITGDNPTATLNLMLVGVRSSTVVPSASGALSGTLWKWQRTRTPAEVIEPPDPDHYSIEFLVEGRYAGQADCNRILGGFSTEGSRITIQPGATTLMACPEGSLDTVFVQQLFAVDSYAFKAGLLLMRMRDDGGTMEFAV